jgi:hypothetical protein
VKMMMTMMDCDVDGDDGGSLDASSISFGFWGVTFVVGEM